MKPIRFDEKLAEKYVKEGYWDAKAILSDYWESNAQKWPDKEALVDSRGTRLTWQQAVQKINRIALALVKELKLNRDDCLIVQLPNMVEHILARIACEKAGVIAIAIQPTFRHTEVKWIAGQIKAAGIVIPRQYRDFDFYEMVQEIRPQLPSLRQVIVVSDDGVPEDCLSLKKIMEYPYEEKHDLQELEARKFDPIQDVGFLYTTTGTTGMPKIIEQQIAAREIWTAKAHIRNWELGPDDVVVAIAPVAGAAGGTPTYVTCPAAGAKIALEYAYREEETLKFIEQERATVIALVPTHLARLLQLPLEQYDLSSLRFIKTAGGALSPALARESEEKFKCPILGTFGSQDTGSVSGVPLTASMEQRYTTVGRLHPGLELRVVDDEGQEVKPGETGVLYFRGPGNAAGYWRDLEKTLTEAFDKDGWATTGDLVTVLDDGYIRIMGRKKDIIIRGGQNIYPKEIEDYLAAHPKVTEAAIVPMPDPEMGERACAFVVLQQGEQFTFEEMVQYLKGKKIAMFKVPERLEVIASLPLAGEAKIDKKALTKAITEKLEAEGKLKS
jgi:non-ribosomal peptide synthetase component E (peptide arylation enzyme)